MARGKRFWGESFRQGLRRLKYHELALDVDQLRYA
jgi:hypothetical protein